MKKLILPIVLLLVALALVLPGIAIARLGPPSRNTTAQNSALPDHNQTSTLSGGSYTLMLQPALMNSRVDKNPANTLTGGRYQLNNQPEAVPGDNGCCCKANLPCTIK